VERNDMSALVGCAFTLEKAVSVVALGRFASGGHANQSHALQLLRSSTKVLAANATVDLGSAAADLNGYAWAKLAAPVSLEAGARYYLVSREEKGGDSWFDAVTMVQSSPGALRGFATPVYQDADGSWVDENATDNDPGFSSGRCYGPLNVMLGDQ
jgi:hypothetical protein